MKGLKLLLLFLLITGSVSAQKIVGDISALGDDYEIVIRKRPQRVDKHEFRLGVGSYSFATDAFLDGIGCIDDVNLGNFRNDMANAESYATKARFLGNYSLSYTYHSRRWLQLGATLTFGSTLQYRRDNITNEIVKNLSRYGGSAMATIRFVYLYREKVQLYSGLSLGIGIGSGFGFPWLDPTLFGCSFGKNFFGFAEIGGGLSGWGRVGIGYRFDSSKKDKK